jgi:hypothetical protein
LYKTLTDAEISIVMKAFIAKADSETRCKCDVNSNVIDTSKLILETILSGQLVAPALNTAIIHHKTSSGIRLTNGGIKNLGHRRINRLVASRKTLNSAAFPRPLMERPPRNAQRTLSDHHNSMASQTQLTMLFHDENQLIQTNQMTKVTFETTNMSHYCSNSANDQSMQFAQSRKISVKCLQVY